VDANGFLVDGPGDADWTLILAHGAGAPADSDFMNAVSTGIAARGVRVVRFEFPYMDRRRKEGVRRPPDRESVLLEKWRDVVKQFDGVARLALGGKSMGGRMASRVADEAGASALVCLGYPFHAPGRPEKPRTEHLRTIETPTLIVQGTRDPFGNEEDVARYDLSPAVRLHWLEDGDHDFKPRRRSGRSHEENLAEAIEVTAGFIFEQGG
jgi:uncharacterized protein